MLFAPPRVRNSAIATAIIFLLVFAGSVQADWGADMGREYNNLLKNKPKTSSNQTSKPKQQPKQQPNSWNKKLTPEQQMNWGKQQHTPNQVYGPSVVVLPPNGGVVVPIEGGASLPSNFKPKTEPPPPPGKDTYDEAKKISDSSVPPGRSKFDRELLTDDKKPNMSFYGVTNEQIEARKREVTKLETIFLEANKNKNLSEVDRIKNNNEINDLQKEYQATLEEQDIRFRINLKTHKYNPYNNTYEGGEPYNPYKQK